MATTIEDKPKTTTQSPTLVSRLSMISSILGLLLAVGAIAAVLVIRFAHLTPPPWAFQAQQLVTEVGVALGTMGILLNLLESATILARHETYDPRDAAKQYAIDDANAILDRFRQGCLVQVTLPVALVLGLIALLLGLISPPAFDGMKVVATNAPQSCATSPALAPFSFQLDNSTSTISVAWSAAPVESVGQGSGQGSDTPWAQVVPAQGSLGAGQRLTVQVIPNILLCQFVTQQTNSLAATGHGYAALRVKNAPAEATFHVKVTIDGQTQRSTTVDMSVTGGASGPPPAQPYLSWSPTQPISVDCGASAIAFPTVYIANLGQATLTWQAQTTQAGAAVSPTSGTLEANQVQTLTVTQPGPATTATNVTLTSNGGNGSVYFGCSAVVTPTPTPTHTPPPSKPARLSVSPTGTTQVNCFGSSVSYPAITVSNTGGQALNWSASTTASVASVSPSSGSLAPGGSKQLTVSQAGPTSAATNVNISSNGGNATVTFSCISGTANLKVTQNKDISQNCVGSPAAPYPVTLDNTGSNVAVGWQFNAIGGWASANPASDTVGAGQTATVQISPSVCPSPGTSTTYQATLHLSIPQGGSEADLGLTDTITGLAPVVNFHLNPNLYPVDGNWWSCGGDPNNPNTPGPVTVTMDNTASNVSVNWSVAAQQYAPFTFNSATSGTIPAGGTGTFVVVPISSGSGSACNQSEDNGTHWNFTVTLTGTGAGTYTFAYNIIGFQVPIF